MLVKDPMRHEFRPWCDFSKERYNQNWESIHEMTMNLEKKIKTPLDNWLSAVSDFLTRMKNVQMVALHQIYTWLRALFWEILTFNFHWYISTFVIYWKINWLYQKSQFSLCVEVTTSETISCVAYTQIRTKEWIKNIVTFFCASIFECKS